MCYHLAIIFFGELSHYNFEKFYRFITYNKIKLDFNFCGLSCCGSTRLLFANRFLHFWCFCYKVLWASRYYVTLVHMRRLRSVGRERCESCERQRARCSTVEWAVSQVSNGGTRWVRLLKTVVEQDSVGPEQDESANWPTGVLSDRRNVTGP